jgi:hypothetical protein
MKTLTTFASILLLASCAARQPTIGGTGIADSTRNRGVISALEAYRQAVEGRDTEALLLMASNKYWEDSGTSSGGDDYGYDGLKDVLAGRFQKANKIRYAMRYVSLRQNCAGDLVAGCQAKVEALIDASFSVTDARGQERRPDKRDQNEFVLEWTGDKWLFVSGM